MAKRVQRNLVTDPSDTLRMTVESFVVDDKTAFEALAILHHRLYQLSADYHCPQALYYLTSDLGETLANKDEYYNQPSGPHEGDFS